MRREIRRFRSYVSSIWSSPMELPELFLSAPIEDGDDLSLSDSKKRETSRRKIPLFLQLFGGGGRDLRHVRPRI